MFGLVYLIWRTLEKKLRDDLFSLFYFVFENGCRSDVVQQTHAVRLLGEYSSLLGMLFDLTKLFNHLNCLKIKLYIGREWV
jgi:hypothetical protein